MTDDLSHGVTLDQLSIWRDAETQNVIFQVPEGRSQIVMTPDQWQRCLDFLGAQPRCTCSDVGGAPSDVGGTPLCPIHDLEGNLP